MVTTLDWIALAFVLVAAMGGAVQGFVWSGLSLAGLAVGAFVGGRLAPHILPGGSSSAYAPVVALAGAVGLAVALELLASSVGAAFRTRERSTAVRRLDS